MAVNNPLISVVTPFHNTAAYLAECIESVLAQSDARFEYILSDNCSTDGSLEIAEKYASSDSRIRLIKQRTLLSQVQHYNHALAQISPDSRYCKIVQADDTIFPDCLKLMVRAFEQSESIGLVSAYDIKANLVRGSGFPYPLSFVSGKEVAQMYLRTGIFVFGSPTTVMYKCDLVRERSPFYDESLLHEDTEKCMQILGTRNFGFVHQVLSFLRVDSRSVSGNHRNFRPDALDRYIIVRRYSPTFLDATEALIVRKKAKSDYYRVLATEALKFASRDLWKYHRQGVATIGEVLDWPYLAREICMELTVMITNPGSTVMRGLRLMRQKIRSGHSREGRPDCALQPEIRVHDENHGNSLHL
jgi:glycosyltransferase involved in cell wall biosynthesis